MPLVGPLAPPSPDIIPGYHWQHMVLRMVELGCHALRKEIRPPAMNWIRIFWRKHRPRRFQVLVHITNWSAGQNLNTWISSQQKENNTVLMIIEFRPPVKTSTSGSLLNKSTVSVQATLLFHRAPKSIPHGGLSHFSFGNRAWLTLNAGRSHGQGPNFRFLSVRVRDTQD